ncbi:MAG: ACT domain-containing protein [Pseudomonadota bacterium]
MTLTVELQTLSESYAVCYLPAAGPTPAWAAGPGFVNISYCSDELSIVCPAKRVPEKVTCERDWTALKLTGSFAFDEAGVLLAAIRPLSENGLGIFAVSTFHRDYLLVKTEDFARAKELLEAAGHKFVT